MKRTTWMRLLLLMAISIVQCSMFNVYAQITIGGNVYGGGNVGNTDGNTNVTVYAGDIKGSVYGGACQANVTRSTFVNIDGEHISGDIKISAVYGGNDIAGRVGASNLARENVPTQMEKAADNGITPKSGDNAGKNTGNYNAFVLTTPERTETTGEGSNASSTQPYHIFIGQLFGGGNGDYRYTTITETNPEDESNPIIKGYKAEKLQADGISYETVATSTTILEKPELPRTYLELRGGTFGYVYGGGNNATVTDKTDICIAIDKKITPWDINGAKDSDPDDDVLSDAELIEMGINTEYFDQNAHYHFSRVFGGNNKAEMAIRPTWHLLSGRIENLYSGGNEGPMTNPQGLLLEIKENSDIVAENVFGGCRKADVHPNVQDDNDIKLLDRDENGQLKYRFPAGLAARVLIKGGDINNVYGGNDVKGRVYGGNAVGVYTSIRGDIYGGGNGSYAYTDNSQLAQSLRWGDFYYDIPEGKTSVQALNDTRPNAEQVSIHVLGTKDKPTIIGGSIYVGGNSATLKMKEGATMTETYPRVELKVGSYVIADKVFLGNNGEHMVDQTENGVLAKYHGTVKGTDYHFSTLDFKTDAAAFATYMDGVAMDIKPKLVFDKVSNQDAHDYEPYTTQFGSFYLGGNVGSMTYTGVNNAKLDAKIIIFDKLVGGSNNANVPASDYNAAYEGGIIGSYDSETGNKLVLNIAGPKIRPQRWKVQRTGETGEDYDKKEVDENGNVIYVLDNKGNRQLEWNLVDNRYYNSTTKKFREVNPDPDQISEVGEASEDDLARRFAGGNVYGGCCESGRVNGNVVINIDTTLVERDILFDTVESDEFGEEVSLYGTDQTQQTTFNITDPKTGVILAQQGMDVLGAALNVFGGGKGKGTEIWGSTTINLNKGYVFQVFGGSEEGVIGKHLVTTDNNGKESPVLSDEADGNYSNGTYTFNGKSYQYNPAYSCYVNLRGEFAGVTKTSSNNSPDMAECEFLYGGGFFGPIVGNTIVNLGKGRIFNSFTGSCNADILGHAETYIGRQIKVANKNRMGLLGKTLISGSDNYILSKDSCYEKGFPWVRDITYGGNDLGGRILGSKSFEYRVRSNDVLSMVHKNHTVMTANAYTEYLQGRADAIFGGCYGTYNYKDPKYRSFFDEYGDAKSGYSKPFADNAFVNFRPTYTQANNMVNKVYGAGQGYSGDQDRDKMQNHSYVLIDIPQDPNDESYMSYYKNMEVFGAGAWGGLGMDVEVEPIANPNSTQEAELDKHSAIIDLVHGQLAAVYGGSFTEGVTRRAVVNVPEGSTIEIKNIFGGAYGSNYLQPCDVYEANVNYNSDLATVTGAIFGGNNSERRTLYGKVNINSTVWSNKDRSKKYYGTVFGAGLGGNTWSEYTEVNLNDGALVYEVYGGGKAGKVYNAESIEHYMNFFATGSADNGHTEIPASVWSLGMYYNPVKDSQGKYNYISNEKTNLTNVLTRVAEMEDRDYIATNAANYRKYNTNVLIKEGATVMNYAYGGGLGELAKVSGSTYIALLGGTVKKDIYAAGTSGAVQDTLGTRKFIASANAYIKGGTCRNVYGGGWNGSVGKHVGGEDPIFDKDGKTINAIDVIKGPFTSDVYGETHVVIGSPEDEIKRDSTEYLANNITKHAFYYGRPTIQRNAYGGGEGGPVFGSTHLTLNNGYIGYEFNPEGSDVADTEIDERYIEKIVDDTNYDKDGHFIENKNLNDSGCLFGGGYIDNSSVDSTEVKMFGGHVRNAMFGGGEIAAVGRGKIVASGENNAVRNLDEIYKAGKTHLEMFGGHVHRNVFGGGRGYNNLGKLGTLFSDGFVFGQTEVHIHGGEIGTPFELAAGNGNVFGGGDIGYVFSAYEYNDNGVMKLGRGIKSGNRYDDDKEGYYYKYQNRAFVTDNNEYIPTEDCKVLIEPWTKVIGSSDVSFTGIHYAKGHIVSSVDLDYLKKNSSDINTYIDLTGKVIKDGGITFNRSYAPGEYVPIYALNTLKNKNADSGRWSSLDPTGIVIHNAVFAGGNTSSGSSTVYANATSVYGNATASLHDAFHRDLITLGTGYTGGLYGDGNLTFVDGYRGLNITNYGTDFYSISDEVTISEYNALPAREAAYYELKYKCLQQCVDKDGTTYLPASTDGSTKASTIAANDLTSQFLLYDETTKKYSSIVSDGRPILLQDNEGNWNPNPYFWEENGVLPVYAGRLLNSIQRADFCGVFGSRMVMQGAKDRVPDKVDYTNYTINRVREVSLNQQHTVISGDLTLKQGKVPASDPSDQNPDDYANLKDAIHGNYFGIYNIVNYLGALTSDVHFTDPRRTDNNSNSAFAADGTTTYYDWKHGKVKDNSRNNGCSLNKVALASGVYLELTTEKSTGHEFNEKDWGYITGIIELDLINVQTGIGGGFVYAKNEHRAGTSQNLSHVTLTALNAEAITRKNYSYNGDYQEMETSGNFVHSTQTIIDDCYNVSGKYQGSDAVPAHYWYIKGSVYVYDQYISAYTGAPNAYSESVNIPLTITAASHGKMRLLNVMPNRYAYYSAPGVELGGDNKVIINDVSYSKNDPISYWDWYLLSRYEKELFVTETYVTIDSCKIGTKVYPSGYVMLPAEYNSLATTAESNMRVVESGGVAVPAVQMMTKNDAGEEVPVTDSNGANVYKAFDFVFRSSNNMSHETGYILTYKVNNPTEWSTWYTEKSDISHNPDIAREKDQIGGDDYDNGPTYHLKSSTGTVLGQRDYKPGDLISKEVYDTYEGTPGNGVKSHVTGTNGTQATFVPAHLVTSQYNSSDGHHNNPGSAVSEPVEGFTSPAFICTSTIQLSTTEIISINTKMTEAEKNSYIRGIKTQIEALGIVNGDSPTEAEINALSAEKKKELTSLQAIKKDLNDYIVPAYFCTVAGKYGGNYYEGGKNYRGLEAWSSMSSTDREQFIFNYDALDLLIDPDYSKPEGKKYQYDGNDYASEDQDVTNPAGYSLEQRVDYTAEYVGNSSLTLGEGQTVAVIGNSTPQSSLSKGDELRRTAYESLTNEQRYYAPIKVQESNKVEVDGQNPKYKVYVVSSPFQIGNSPYAVGTVLSTAEYNTLGDEQVHVTQLEFPYTSDYKDKTFYFCRESYTIGEHGNGVAVSNATGVSAKNSSNEDVTVTRETTATSEVPVGLIINDAYYTQISDRNQQKNFTIHGIAPTETSTLFVSRESDIFDLSKEKIITVIYQYDYDETDTNGNITPISERHVVNIHIEFESGVPSVEDIKAPQIVIPGDYVGLREPNVTSGAYEVTGGGWELFETINDAESHTNGIEYSPQYDPLFWYQDDWYVAYYAKTYLGKTYSNHVQLSVANYHDLKKVMEALEHHYHVDNTNVKREPKIYINDYSQDATGSKNGLDLLKSLFDLSVLNNPSVNSETGLISSGEFTGHKPLGNIVRGGDNLEFILHTDIDHGPTTTTNPAYDPENPGTTPAIITENHPWTSIGSGGTDCFAGTLHGDGHHLSGLSNSLFYSLCGQVYNLGVSGSFTGAGVAETGNGYVENCWVKTTATSLPENTSKVYAVFGDPSDNKGLQLVNSYFWSGNNALYNTAETDGIVTSGGDRGAARAMTEREFYNGEVAYNLNGFYLHKRYYDGIKQNSGKPYGYLSTDADGVLAEQLSNGYYPESYAIYPLDVTKPKEYGYVENRFADGDFQYSSGKIPEDAEIRMRIVKEIQGTGANAKEVDKTYYLPIWPDDYLFFGQSLNYGHVSGRTHQDVPSAINRSGERLLTTEAGNRVFRAPAYYQSGEMSVAHFNPYAVFAQTKKGDAAVEAYKNLTAIDFTGYNDVTDLDGKAKAYVEGWTTWSKYSYKAGVSGNAYAFFPPLLDDGGLSGFYNADVTRNLLVYTSISDDTDSEAVLKAAQKTAKTVGNYLTDKAFLDHVTNSTYLNVKTWDSPADEVRGHWVQKSTDGFIASLDHILVDKQDFNAPIAYTFNDGQRMWHQRLPEDNSFVDRSKGWQGISLPFTAELVTTNDKGEITHFYSGSEESKNGTKTKIGHEYWLREYRDISGKSDDEKREARFTYPDASDSWETTMDKTVNNTFLWDYYYEGNHRHLDSNRDTYQTYYQTSRPYNGYVMLGKGTPYLIGFPGTTYYEFDLSGQWTAENTASLEPEKIGPQTITFASPEGYKVGVSDMEQRSVTFNGYTFNPSYLNHSFEAGTTTFTLSADGSSYNKVPDAPGQGEPAVNPVAVSAFRPYFTGPAASGNNPARPVTRSIVFSNDDSEMKGVEEKGDPRSDEATGSLMVYAKKHKIIVESALTYTTDVRIVNTAGITVNTFSIEPGETVETRINNSGVYIVQTTDGHYTKKLAVR